MILEDVVGPGLRIIFCGTAAGRRSARLREYYAGPGNKFWRTLHETGLTAGQLAPSQFRGLADFGIGLTDLAKTASGSDAELKISHFDRDRLISLIEAHRPRVLAFNGKKAGSIFLRKNSASIEFGRQQEAIGATALYVLPSTSGAANAHWTIAPWRDLARAVRDRS